ncbi:MAG: hypothetical protein OXT73_03840, partial [Bacteroidota bacterium]|nr:hypothetical protein [Bacteroidota bacterium]
MQRIFPSVLLALLLMAAPRVQAQDTVITVPQVVLDRIGFPVAIELSASDTLGISAYTVAGVNEPVGFEWDED